MEVVKENNPTNKKIDKKIDKNFFFNISFALSFYTSDFIVAQILDNVNELFWELKNILFDFLAKLCYNNYY